MELSSKLLSIIVPCHNEETSIKSFFHELSKITNAIACQVEIIFIDDGSSDHTLQLLKDFYDDNKKQVSVLSFSRNFGKESAMYAGLEKSKGDFVTIMDADLQDPPDLLPQMLQIISTSDYDVIATRRVNRKGEALIRSFFSSVFYKVINKISDVKIVEGARDYRMMTKQVVNAILELNENSRFSKGIAEWVGFKTHYIEFKNTTRKDGRSSWRFSTLFSYAISGIISFSNTPLRVASVCGMIISFLSFIYLIYVIIKTLLFGDPVAGYPSLVAILLFATGIQLLFLGVIGEYIAKLFVEVKNRPKYIVRKMYDGSTQEK